MVIVCGLDIGHTWLLMSYTIFDFLTPATHNEFLYDSEMRSHGKFSILFLSSATRGWNEFLLCIWGNSVCCMSSYDITNREFIPLLCSTIALVLICTLYVSKGLSFSSFQLFFLLNMIIHDGKQNLPDKKGVHYAAVDFFV